MSRPAAADAVLHAGGAYLTVHEGFGVTALTIELVQYDGSLDLELPRVEVERLRDRLTEWLERGAL